jgi:hypothetical protein
VALDIRWLVDGALVRDWGPLDSLASGSIVAPVEGSVTVEVRVTDLAGRIVSGAASVAAGSWTRP